MIKDSKAKNFSCICSSLFLFAGKRNIIKQFEKEAKDLLFNVASKEVDEAFGKQNEELFFKGLRQQQEGHAYCYVLFIGYILRILSVPHWIEH